jgi:hypothetical protein
MFNLQCSFKYWKRELTSAVLPDMSPAHSELFHNRIGNTFPIALNLQVVGRLKSLHRYDIKKGNVSGRPAMGAESCAMAVASCGILPEGIWATIP